MWPCFFLCFITASSDSFDIFDSITSNSNLLVSDAARHRISVRPQRTRVSAAKDIVKENRYSILSLPYGCHFDQPMQKALKKVTSRKFKGKIYSQHHFAIRHRSIIILPNLFCLKPLQEIDFFKVILYHAYACVCIITQ